MITNPVIENIMSRASVRQFTNEAVDPEQIDALLHAAMAAPSGVNKQPWHLVAVTNRETLEALSHANPYGALIAKAALAIVVCGNEQLMLPGLDRELWIQDCSAASQNVLLAAHSMGLGAVWTCNYPHEDRCQGVQQALQLPAHLVPLNTIAIGHPAKPAKVQEKWDETKVTRID